MTAAEMPPPMTATAAVEDARQGALLGDARSGRTSTAAEKEREETPTPTFQAGASVLAEEAEAPREVADTAMSDKKRAESRADASAAMPPSPDSSSESAGLRQVVRGKRARRKTSEAAAARAIETLAASPFTPGATAEPEAGTSAAGGAVVAVEKAVEMAEVEATSAKGAVDLPDDAPLKALLTGAATAPAATSVAEERADGTSTRVKASPKPAALAKRLKSIKEATAAAKKVVAAKAKANARARAKRAAAKAAS